MGAVIEGIYESINVMEYAPHRTASVYYIFIYKLRTILVYYSRYSDDVMALCYSNYNVPIGVYNVYIIIYIIPYSGWRIFIIIIRI